VTGGASVGDDESSAGGTLCATGGFSSPEMSRACTGTGGIQRVSKGQLACGRRGSAHSLGAILSCEGKIGDLNLLHGLLGRGSAQNRNTHGDRGVTYWKCDC
jgi:hypothetical protein